MEYRPLFYGVLYFTPREQHDIVNDLAVALDVLRHEIVFILAIHLHAKKYLVREILVSGGKPWLRQIAKDVQRMMRKKQIESRVRIFRLDFVLSCTGDVTDSLANFFAILIQLGGISNRLKLVFDHHELAIFLKDGQGLLKLLVRFYRYRCRGCPQQFQKFIPRSISLQFIVMSLVNERDKQIEVVEFPEYGEDSELCL